MQFNFYHTVHAIFNAINDLLEFSKYALMTMCSSQVVSLKYVVIFKESDFASRFTSMEPTFRRVSYMGSHAGSRL